MSHLSQLAYLILPLILAGFSNMVWMKLPILNNLRIPMDRGKVLVDGERLLGDNKTWKGFLGMILVSAFWLQIFEFLAKNWAWAAELSLIPYTQFVFPLNGWFYGAIWGFFYVLFELPNSYVKRRLKIEAGQEGKGFLGQFFKIVDQADSVLGCLLGMLFFYIPSLIDACLIFILATGFHYATNVLLYYLGLKKQAA